MDDNDVEAIRLEDTPRQSIDSDDSDISYKDNLDHNPFDEKDWVFANEGRMEDGEEGYVQQPRRVSIRIIRINLYFQVHVS